MAEIVSVNGQISAPEEAKISVFDRGFLYGDGVYEVTRSYGRVLFALEDHIDRLFNSAESISLKIPYSKNDLIKELYRIADAANQDDIYLRIVITRGEGRIALDPNASTKPNIVVFVQNLPAVPQGLYVNGQDLVTSSVQRNSKRALDPNVKSGNYLNNILALGEAKKKKAYDAVMVNRDGFVTEGTTWNIFIVKDNTFVTPPDSADMLRGITRKIIRKLCQENKFKWEERFFTSDEVKAADEAFTTGSIKEIMGVRSLDATLIKDGKPGPMTLKLAQVYTAYVKKYCDEHRR